MKALLVFNAQNDLVFWRWDALFVKHALQLAAGQGLVPEPRAGHADSEQAGELNPDVVIQIFSPIITSQRIMGCQFGNSYTSVQCKDGTNIVFDEYVSYLLVQMGRESVSWLQRSLATAISFIKYFCGPDVSLLKNERQKAGVTLALCSWERLAGRDQATLLGATEALAAPELAATALAALKSSLATLPPAARPAHAALFTNSKLLSLYSSRGADDLSPGDTSFFSVMCSGAQDSWARRPPSDGSSSPEPDPEDDLEDDSFECENFGQAMSWTVILGEGEGSPHGLQLLRLARGTTLALATAVPGAAAAAPTAAALRALAALSAPLAQRDLQLMQSALTSLDVAMKKSLDALKKHRGHPESPARKLTTQWEALRSRARSTATSPAPPWPALEAQAGALAVGLRTALQLACGGFAPPQLDARPAAQAAAARLRPLSQALMIKARSGAARHSSPAMSKYVEEFPGLVHFLHIDRTNHRLTAPALLHCSHMLSRKKIWQMVERGSANVRAGHLATMWKDEALHYAHLVWFEDAAGAPLKPRPPQAACLPPHNLTPHHYYNKLTEVCFPGSGNIGRVRCWELLAAHLGLLPAGTALAHVRRLAATVSDLHAPQHPAASLL